MGGRPNLPSTREEKFQAFNSLLTETSKQLPPTDPEIQTRQFRFSCFPVPGKTV